MSFNGIVGALAASGTCLLTALSAHAAPPTPVTECGQQVRSGVLLAHLDCSAHAGGPAVVVGKGLDLSGFTITGSTDVDSTGPFGSKGVVGCTKRCRILGPGIITGGHSGIEGRSPRVVGATISGNAIYGIHGRAPVRVDDSTVEVNGADGIHAHKAKVRGSVIRDNGRDGIFARARARLSGTSILRNNASGVSAGDLASVTVAGCLVAENGRHGISGGRRHRLSEATVSGNGSSGVVAFDEIKASDSIFTANASHGVVVSVPFDPAQADPFDRAELVGCQVVGNGGNGVRAPRVIDHAGDVTDNCSTAGTGCADVVSCREPRLDGTTCGTSSDCFGATWDTCDLD